MGVVAQLGLLTGTVGQSDATPGAAGTSPEGTGLSAGVLGGPGVQEGEELAGPLKLGLPSVTGSDPEALGGGTESPPIGAVPLATLGEAGVLAKVAGLEPALAGGALKAGFPPLPQAATKTLAATTAPAVARPAGTRLLRRRSAVS